MAGFGSVGAVTQAGAEAETILQERTLREATHDPA